jgi:hypothetical protein
MPTNIIPFAGILAAWQFISISPHFPNAGMGQRETRVNHSWPRSTPCLPVEIVRWSQRGMAWGKCAGTNDGPIHQRNQHQHLITKGPCCCCQSGCRRVRRECNGCVCPATRLRIRSDGHIFARGMPDRTYVLSPACGPERDGAARGLRSSSAFWEGAPLSCRVPGPVI